jgi:hypothetical protein
MKTKLITLIIVTILLAANTVGAASKVQLRLNLQKGATYEMKMSSINQIEQEMMGQKIKIDQKIEMVFTYTVLDILPDKNFLIEYSFSQMKMDMNMNGQEIKLDSESTNGNPMNATIKDLLSFKLKLTLSPKGQVIKAEGLDEYAKKLSGNQQLAQAMKMFTDENNFKSFFAQTFNYFPENEVSVGDQWESVVKMPELMDVGISMNFEVVAIENNQIHLNFKSIVDMETPVEQMGMKMNVKMAGTQSGKITVNANDGWMRSSDLNQKFDMKIKMKNPQSGEDMEIPMVTNSVTNIVGVKK